MAPVAATVALSHVEGVSDSARARELYKYASNPVFIAEPGRKEISYRMLTIVSADITNPMPPSIKTPAFPTRVLLQTMKSHYEI
jgi:hypothetical protein